MDYSLVYELYKIMGLQWVIYNATLPIYISQVEAARPHVWSVSVDVHPSVFSRSFRI